MKAAASSYYSITTLVGQELGTVSPFSSQLTFDDNKVAVFEEKNTIGDGGSTAL